MKKQSKEDLSMFSKEVLIGLIDYMQQALKYQKEQIDKAIEYIEQVNKDKDQVPYLTEGETLKLLDILRGKDDE